MIEKLEQMLKQGQDNSMLRFGLGKAYLDNKQPDKAIEHFQVCLQHDKNYSAAWKLLGKCYVVLENWQQAAEIYQQGINIANEKGDKQAEKEMLVFLKRCNKQLNQ
ncbi:tetratricopeptide repeat protein [Endozoicomonas sp. SM1973]|uniref:Tetratricopeptide repeat protein n=1 Tax=Spartinivicinus marinus TaxID=2994442 RepID=A0A853IC18_9GAMM|nr:tetratricopeptide repeat protein [Spartinivicinus marinus]MCX4026900.1 tetratricopeptide repeat protein [Spartinivicinus marinus]NYZ66755.1 tetratricopeptide repeat protein [Spartinivicinus marinus]